jgi:hypothetical protein
LGPPTACCLALALLSSASAGAPIIQYVSQSVGSLRYVAPPDASKKNIPRPPSPPGASCPLPLHPPAKTTNTPREPESKQCAAHVFGLKTIKSPRPCRPSSLSPGAVRSVLPASRSRLLPLDRVWRMGSPRPLPPTSCPKGSRSAFPWPPIPVNHADVSPDRLAIVRPTPSAPVHSQRSSPACLGSR